MKLSVVYGPSNAYGVPAVNVLVRVTVPRMIPFPVLLPVIVSVFDGPVPIEPPAIETFTAWTLLLNATFVADEILLTVRLLKLVAPEMLAPEGPAKTNSDVVGVNVTIIYPITIECVYAC